MYSWMVSIHLPCIRFFLYPTDSAVSIACFDSTIITISPTGTWWCFGGISSFIPSFLGVLHWYCMACVGLLHCGHSCIGAIHSYTLRLLFLGNVCATHTSPTERVLLLRPSILLLLPISSFFLFSRFARIMFLSPNVHPPPHAPTPLFFLHVC